jgi:hypothetical protein
MTVNYPRNESASNAVMQCHAHEDVTLSSVNYFEKHSYVERDFYRIFKDPDPGLLVQNSRGHIQGWAKLV